MLRQFRLDLKQGQTSPPFSSDIVIEQINVLYDKLNRPLRILDIGCGSGFHRQRIHDAVSNRVAYSVGIDWSPAAVARLQTTAIYDYVILAQSNQLPFDSDSFDIAFSLENLEHLYVHDVIPAIQEMQRVADWIVITTPLPQYVIDHEWLNKEIPLAQADTVTVDVAEFQAMEGTVHKSVVFPDSIQRAGFVSHNELYGRYTARSCDIDISKITVQGIEPVPFNCSYNQTYIDLLQSARTWRE